MPDDAKGKPLAFQAAMEPIVASQLTKAGLRPTMARAIVAQMALETGSGASVNGNNFGNIKATAGWGGQTLNLMTTEHENGEDVRVRQPFRSYHSVEAGVADYVQSILRNPRYAAAVTAKTPLEFFSELKKAGYATDPNYVDKVASLYGQLSGG